MVVYRTGVRTDRGREEGGKREEEGGGRREGRVRCGSVSKTEREPQSSSEIHTSLR